MAATYAAPALPGFRPSSRPLSGRRLSGRRLSGRPVAAGVRPVAAGARPGASARSVRPVAGRAPAMRMTRRGRLVILAVALLVVLLPGAWRAMATAQVEGPATVAVTVQPGDTLWGIAAAMDPGADPRALIAQMRELNGLTQSGLVPGQVLVVPAG